MLDDLVHALELRIQKVDISTAHPVLGSIVSDLIIVNANSVHRWAIWVYCPMLRDRDR